MGDPELSAVGRDVHTLVHDVHATKIVCDVLPGELVVITRHENHMHTLARFSQDLLHHIVVELRPVPAATQLPAVNDVAHEIQGLAARVAQKVQKRLSLTSRRTQVKIRDPHGADVDLDGGIIIHAVALSLHGPIC